MKTLIAPVVALALSCTAIGAETLVCVTATWCGPCKRFHRDYEDDGSLAGGREVKMLDVDVDREAAKRLRVRSMPTFILMDGDKEVRRTTGYDGSAAFKKWLDSK